MYNPQRLGTKWKLSTPAQRDNAQKQINNNDKKISKSVINTLKCGDIGKSRPTNLCTLVPQLQSCLCEEMLLSCQYLAQIGEFFLYLMGQLLILM